MRGLRILRIRIRDRLRAAGTSLVSAVRSEPVEVAAPALANLRGEARETLIRFLAYVGGIGALSFFAAHVFQTPAVEVAVEPEPRPEWVTVAKPYPAFLLTLPDLGEESRYAILRNQDGGGRKDIMTFGELGRSLRYVMVEIYRPGSEIERFGNPMSEIAARAAELSPVAVPRPSLPLKTKFGTFSTAEFSAGRFGIGHCIGFVRSMNDPRLQIAGMSCSMDHLVNRNAVACALDRLSLMSAGSDPDIAKFFAQAEIKRNFCGQRDPLLYATPKRDYPNSAATTASMPFQLRGGLPAR
jgi:hypothetical protein